MTSEEKSISNIVTMNRKNLTFVREGKTLTVIGRSKYSNTELSFVTIINEPITTQQLELTSLAFELGKNWVFNNLKNELHKLNQ